MRGYIRNILLSEPHASMVGELNIKSNIDFSVFIYFYFYVSRSEADINFTYKKFTCRYLILLVTFFGDSGRRVPLENFVPYYRCAVYISYSENHSSCFHKRLDHICDAKSLRLRKFTQPSSGHSVIKNSLVWAFKNRPQPYPP